MNEENKRGQNTALIGLFLQGALAALLCTIWLLTGSLAAKSVFLLTVTGLPIWIITAAMFYSRRLADLEADELNAVGDSALFENESNIRLAERRMNLIARWLAPAVTILVGGSLAAIAYLIGKPLLGGLPIVEPTGRALMWAFFCLGGAFCTYLFSRYVVGMASTSHWTLLRAGGGSLTLATLASAALCGSFFLEHLEILWALQILPGVLAALMALLGCELLANFVMDFYRPRKPGDEIRPSFDSRLVRLLSEPGGVAHSIAGAMNYQFGFEVSSTWFYQLLSKTVGPLLLFGLASLVAISSIVIIGPGQTGVVLHWGQAKPATLGEGLHLKAPWPIQTVDIVETARVRTLWLGVSDIPTNTRVRLTDEATEKKRGHRLRNSASSVKVQSPLFLWKENHGDYQELDFLVARKHSGRTTNGPHAEEQDKYGAFGLLRVAASIEYKIRDPHKYLYGVADAESLLSEMATRELTRYTARRDVDMLMNRQGQKVDKELFERISAAAEDDLGLEIISVAVRGVHPPPDIAEAFEEVIKADLERTGEVLAAQTTADSLLSAMVGSTGLARRIVDANLHLQQLRDSNAPAEEIAAAERAAYALFDQAGGEVQAVINRGKTDRWINENAERGRWLAFENELAAYKASPNLYRLTEKLKVLNEALTDVRKYVIGIDRDRLEIRQTDDRRVMGGGFSLGE